MNLYDLTDPDAVRAAMRQFDEMGRARFLEQYGYQPARSYFLEHEGKRYDSKAIAGVAIGKQYPDRGPLRSDEFSGGNATVKAKLEALGFRVTADENPQSIASITAADVELLGKARSSGVGYYQLPQDQKQAYQRIHEALQHLGAHTLAALGGSGEYTLKLTSGFNVLSGVRGSQPKDLWFGIFPTENADAFVGNPQIFAIVSSRGVEYGFGASTHPGDFSNSLIKAKVRQAAPHIFDRLPGAGSAEAARLSEALQVSGGWKFRRKARLQPGSDFSSLPDWLNFMKSPKGKAEAGGGIYRYLVGQQIDETDLYDELTGTAQIFKPLMESIRPGAAPEIVQDQPATEGSSFATLMREALELFANARQGPMETVPPLWSKMGELVEKLRSFPAVQSRPHILVKWSFGKGVWAKIPWIALLNANITTTTQKGLYGVFLASEDLSRLYLNLAQGVTEYLNQYPAAAAGVALEKKAAEIRARVGALESAGFTLGNTIDLGSDGTLARNYEKGTIAYVEFDLANLPDDDHIAACLEALLSAYDAEAAHEPVGEVLVPLEEDALPEFPPYGVEDAMDGLFMDQAFFEKILSTWRNKKNIVLQGAPGVGKSFVARRLAYALVGAQDPSRVETVQFHQSYGYEDFVQGFRPTESGGFALRDGIFFRFCQAALANPDKIYVFIIDEINRGNLSKIFGELMLLVEADKRSPDWGARLAYAKAADPKFHVPENLHIVGMMNTADRSLSMVDYALRRRFAFFDLEPAFETTAFRQHLLSKQVPQSVTDTVIARMTELNGAIAADKVNLGPGFRIGHSFFVPSADIDDAEEWTARVMETEILPLLQEYWFDDPAKAESWYDQLRS